jgi:hypothetical protein
MTIFQLFQLFLADAYCAFLLYLLLLLFFRRDDQLYVRNVVFHLHIGVFEENVLTVVRSGCGVGLEERHQEGFHEINVPVGVHQLLQVLVALL